MSTSPKYIKKGKQREAKSITAFVTAFAFLITQLSPVALAWVPARPFLQEVKVPSRLPLSVPPELGRISDVNPGPGPLVVHLQTAHGNYEAQKRIEAILHHLRRQYGFKLLLLEGSAYKLQPEILRFLPYDARLTHEIADRLTRKALVKGPELFLLEAPEAEAYGIETLESYRKNREAFKAVLLEEEAVGQFLEQMDLGIERLTGPYLRKNLRSFLKRLEAFERGEIPLTDWLNDLGARAKVLLGLDLGRPAEQIDWPMLVRIYKLRELEKKLNPAQFEKERKKFLREIGRFLPKEAYTQIETLLSSPLSPNAPPDPETGLLFEAMASHLPANFNYKVYSNVNAFIGRLILQSELKGERLFEEMKRLENQIQEKLIRTEEEREVVSLLKDHRLLQRLLALELTPGDYDVVAKRRRALRPSRVIGRLLAINRLKRVKDVPFSYAAELDPLFEKAVVFYQGVKARDLEMLENVTSRFRETGEEKAVVVTGGFHAAPLKSFLQSRGFGYVSITPRLTQKEGKGAYLESILQKQPDLFNTSTMEDVAFSLGPDQIQGHGKDAGHLTGAVIKTLIEGFAESGRLSRIAAVNPSLHAKLNGYELHYSGAGKGKKPIIRVVRRGEEMLISARAIRSEVRSDSRPEEEGPDGLLKWLSKGEREEMMRGYNRSIPEQQHFIQGVRKIEVVEVLKRPHAALDQIEGDYRFFWPHVAAASWAVQWIADNGNEFIKDRADGALQQAIYDWLTNWENVLVRALSNEGERDYAPRVRIGVLPETLHRKNFGLSKEVDWFGDVWEVTNGSVRLNFLGPVTVGAFTEKDGALSVPDAAYFYRILARPEYQGADFRISRNVAADTEHNVREIERVSGKKPEAMKFAILIRERHYSILRKLKEMGVQFGAEDLLGDGSINFKRLESEAKKKGFYRSGNVFLIRDGDLMPVFKLVSGPEEERLDAILGAGGPNEVLMTVLIGKIFGAKFRGMLIPAKALTEGRSDADIEKAPFSAQERSALLRHNLFPLDVTEAEKAEIRARLQDEYALNRWLTDEQRRAGHIWGSEAIPGKDGILIASNLKLALEPKKYVNPWLPSLEGIQFDPESGNVTVHAVRATLAGDVRVLRVTFYTRVQELRNKIDDHFKEIEKVRLEPDEEVRENEIEQLRGSISKAYYLLGRIFAHFQRFEEAYRAFAKAREYGTPGQVKRADAAEYHYKGLEALIRQEKEANEKALEFLERSLDTTRHLDSEEYAGTERLVQLLLKWLGSELEVKIEKTIAAGGQPILKELEKARDYWVRRNHRAPYFQRQNDEHIAKIAVWISQYYPGNGRSEVRSGEVTPAQVDSKNLPRTSAARLFSPSTPSNSFALDGFPKLVPGKSWQERLKEIIEGWGALDMTTNQTLLRQLVESGVLDGRIGELAKEKRPAEEIYAILYTESALEAARIFSGVQRQWPSEGRVSQEASALLNDVAPLVEAIHKIHAGFKTSSGFTKIPNLGGFTKVPNLAIGPRAVKEAVRAGVNVNVTLVFSLSHYLDTVEAYVTGLEERVIDLRKQHKSDEEIRQDLRQIFSVNSLFVSRIDRAVDKLIDETIAEEKDQAVRERLKRLKGKTAVAVGQIAYRIFEAVFRGEHFRDPEKLFADAYGSHFRDRIEDLAEIFGQLRSFEANPQRLLIASSGVKEDQPYHPLLYVLPFLGPYMHNTLPEGTLKALSEFVGRLSEEEAEELKERSLISEGVPALEQTAETKEEWLRSLLDRSKANRISPDSVLHDIQELVLSRRLLSLRAIGDDLRNKGAKGFEDDERATLQVIRERVSQLDPQAGSEARSEVRTDQEKRSDILLDGYRKAFIDFIESLEEEGVRGRSTNQELEEDRAAENLPQLSEITLQEFLESRSEWGFENINKLLEVLNRAYQKKHPSEKLTVGDLTSVSLGELEETIEEAFGLLRKGEGKQGLGETIERWNRVKERFRAEDWEFERAISGDSDARFVKEEVRKSARVLWNRIGTTIRIVNKSELGRRDDGQRVADLLREAKGALRKRHIERVHSLIARAWGIASDESRRYARLSSDRLPKRTVKDWKQVSSSSKYAKRALTDLKNRAERLRESLRRSETRATELKLDLSRVSEHAILKLSSKDRQKLLEIQSNLVARMKAALETEEGRVSLIKGWQEWLMPWVYFGVRMTTELGELLWGFDVPWRAIDFHPVLSEIVKAAQTVNEKDIKNWVHLGAGGSSLTTQALLMPVIGRNHNELSEAQRRGRPRVYWAGHNYDPEHLVDILRILEGRGELFKTVFHIVSKSGTTGETFAAYNVVRHWLETRLGQIRSLQQSGALSNRDLARLGLTPEDLDEIDGSISEGRWRYRTGRFFAVTTGFPQTKDVQVDQDLFQRLVSGKTSRKEILGLKSEFLRQHFLPTGLDKTDPFLVLLPVPEGMGGRFSTFSPVGLLDLAVVAGEPNRAARAYIGDAIDANRDAVRKFLRDIPADSPENVPFRTAYAFLRWGSPEGSRPAREILDLFNFAPQYDAVAQLMRELWNESVEDRREEDEEGKGPTLRTLEGTLHDHTDVQGIIGGKKDLKIEWIWQAPVSQKNDLQLAPQIAIDPSVKSLEGHTLGTIQEKAAVGNANDFKSHGIATLSWILPERNLYNTASLLATLQILVAVFGDLRELDDETYLQRHVEGYKRETKKALGEVEAKPFGRAGVPTGPTEPIEQFLSAAGITLRSEVRSLIIQSMPLNESLTLTVKILTLFQWARVRMALKQFHDQTQLNPAQLKLLTGQINSVVNLAVQRKVGRAKFLKTTLPVYLKNVRTAGIPYPDIENTFSSTYLALLDRSAEETTNLSDIFSREIEVKTTGLPAIPYQTERAKLIEKLMQQGVDLAEVEWSQVERSVYETIRWFTKDKIPFQVKFTPAMELPETFPIHTFGDGVAIPVDWDPKPINYVEPQRVEIIAIGSTDRSEVRAEKFGDRVNIYPDRRSMGEAAARLGIEKIEELLKSQETARIVFAAAPSQVETIEALVRLSKGRIDWSRIEIFHMDEFAGFPEGHPVSFRTWLDDNLINPLIREHGVPREALKINLIQADSRERTELEREAERYGRLLSEKPIDIVFGGYGYNGHVAFNDPPADFETSQNVIVVNPAEDPVNAQQQIEAYPDYFKSAADIPLAVTISLPPMKRAKLLILSVPGKVKAEAIRDIHSVEGKAENALADPKVPGTFFNSLPPERIQIFTDPAGATLLPGRSEVRKRNEGIKTLLVVEDSDSDFAALKEKLAGEEAFRGIRVLRARSARGAKRILRRRGKEIDAGVFDFHLMSIAKYATLSEEEWWPHSPLAIFNEMRRLRLNFSVVIMVGSNLWPRDSLKGIPAPIWDFAWKNEDYGQVIASLKNLDRELRPPDPASAKLLKLLRVAGMGPPFAGRSEARERRFVDVDQKGRFKPDGRPIVIFIEDDRRQMDFYKDSLFDALVEADHNQLLLVETLADEQVALEIATTAAVPKIIIADDQFPRTEGAQAQSLAEEVVTSAKKLGIPIVILSLRPKEEVIKTPTVEPDVFISKRDEMLFFKILAATHKFLSSRSEARSVIEKNLRLSELLQPSRLDSRFEEWKRNRPAGNAPPVRIVHLFPRSLQRYAFNLDNGLRGSGLPVEIAELSDDRTDIALVQLHGAESESPVAGYSGRKIVLVHRPEETLKRFNEAQISDFLGNAEAIVLLGESWVNEYRKRFPEKVVVAIPHGFFEAGQIEPHRLEPHTIQVVGSVTTWGEMRRLDDAIKLIRALKEQGSHSPILGYLGGTIDPKREDINRFKNDHDVWLLSNSEIQSAGDLGKYRDFFSFRKWLYDEARDRIIIRTDTAPESYAPIPKWEKQLVDFNVQFYREILKDDEPKVEYSGTLHLQAAPAIYVVLDSPSMHDVLKNEGFQMILVPARGKEIDYSEGAKRIRELISKPRERQRILENNLQAARRLGMEQIAFAYYTLITNLGIPRRSEARAVPKLGPTRPDLEAKYKKQVEASTPDYVKRNKLFDIHQKGAITVTLKREHLQPYDEKRNPEGLGLWAWLKDYEKEAKVATAGIRFAQNILYPWDTRFRINLVGVALATLGKALVAKERFSGAKLQKLAGGEVRYNTQEYIDLIARIQATQGIKTYLPSGRQTLPVWMASFLTFMYDLAGAEYVTSSHANSSFIATKDIDEEGSQYLPEESLRFVEKIREIFEKAETDGEYRFEIAPSDDPLINENFMTLIEDGTNLYAEYLRKGVATDVNLKRIKDIKRRVIVENVGGSLHRTVSPIFEKLGISNSFEWFRTQQDPFFHGIGKDIKDGRFIDYTQDVTIVKRDPKTGEVVSIPVAERMGYDTLLKDKEIGTVLLMADPDGDRMVTAQIESADRAGFLKGVGVDYLQLDDQRIVALYSPNQSFLLSMVYQAQSLKDAGLWDKHPRFIIMTTASSSAWREWAEKNGVNVLNVPVGFKEIAAMQRKIEHQIKSNPDQPAIVRDIFGKEVNLGVQPRMLFAGEESGGAIFGPEELILSLGGRMAIGMREKSDGEMLVIQSAMAAYLEELSQTLGLKQGLFLSDYFHLIVSPSKFDRTLFKTRDIRGQYPVESDINGKFDVREDVVYYNQSEPNPDILKKDKEVGEARRTKNYVFYLSLALAYRDGKVTKEQIISILNDLFGKDGFNFGDLSEIYFVGDGVFFQFPTKVLEIRPSGTDAKSKSYAMGENKGELARYAAVLGNYSGDITSLHAQYVPPEYSDPTKGMDLAWKRYQEYYRDGLPPKSYLPPSDYVDARSEVRGDLTRKALTDLLHSPLTVKLKTLPEGLKGYHVDITDLGNGTVNPRAFTLRIQLREGERAPKAIEALRAAAAAFQERLIQTFPRYRVSLRHEGRNGVQVSFSQIGFSSSAAERSEVRNVLEAAAREILANRGLATVAAEQRSRLLPERIREEKGEALFAEAVHLFLGEAAFAQEAGTSQKYAAARSILGVSSKSAYAYILAPEFAFNQGGLAFVGTVFGNNPVAVIVRTQNDFDFVEAFNREHGTDILAAGSVKEAQQKLRKGLADRGGTRLGGFVFHGIAAPGEVNADALRNAFPNQVTLMTPGLFERFAEAAGVETLVAELKARFYLARSA